jgi:hypothetical protein
MKDIHNLMSAVTSLKAANRTADANGTGVDLQGYEGAEVIANVGLSGDTLSGTVKIALELEESDDDSTYTDVADADMLGETGAGSGEFALIDDPAEDELTYKVGYIGAKRYIRVVWNITGTHTVGTPGSASIVRMHARHQPAGATQTP